MTADIVIVGGGFGGLEAAFALKALLRPSCRITLVDRSQYHSFIPSIHLILSGKVTADAIRIPLNVVLGASGIRFIQDEAMSIDAAARQLIMGAGTIGYDPLLLSAGAINNFFDIPGSQQFSFRFRTPEDAEHIRSRLLQLLRDGGTPCSIVVAGAGTEGVELIGEVLDLISQEGHEEDLAAGRITIELIEGKSRLLPSLPPEAQDLVEEYLVRKGVRLSAGDRITEVRQDSVLLDSGVSRPASILVWSAGIQPSNLIRGLPFVKDPWGWLKVSDLLQVSDDPDVFGIGDAVSIYTGDGPLALQRLAYHAQDQARVAALNIAAAINGSRPVQYTPKSRPQLISLGKDMGILTTQERVSSGAWVVSLKKAIERKHLLTYLTKPVSSAVWSRVPGAGMLQRLRTKLPL
ncbi:MAG: hypothetical protein A2010_11520 [Nitrospirae bacterium GWD2_57_9]|nr:MAG: hypothetical protein A2010_11520 [Nitrospirae bacterium GWD2_57_9]